MPCETAPLRGRHLRRRDQAVVRVIRPPRILRRGLSPGLVIDHIAAARGHDLGNPAPCGRRKSGRAARAWRPKELGRHLAYREIEYRDELARLDQRFHGPAAHAYAMKH